MSVYFAVKAQDGATLVRHSPVKDDAHNSYVDIAVIGRTLQAKAATSLVAGMAEGTRVDASGYETETSFKGNKEVRYTITKLKKEGTSPSSA